MLTINLFDSEFPTQSCSVAGKTSRLVQYVRNQMVWDGITVFTDRWMHNAIVGEVRSKVKLGWTVEAKSLRPENYNPELRHHFDSILTHDAGLLKAYPEKYTFTIKGGAWTPLDQWGMYPKTKLVSMILSEKRETEFHKLRHAIADSVKGIDLYGPEYIQIGHNKGLALKDYAFSIVCEAREENWFSEHLLDVIAYGCVPIYSGCTNIGDFFNEWVMMRIKSVENVVSLLEWLHLGDYNTYKDFFWYNQKKARQYEITEDWQAEHVYPKFL